ncbi:MAG: hypothetical protein QOI75_6882 [Pseudonocardiales bacterium]|nr:hypothetical protein [Pseudonocardiales bacterium]
MWWPPVMLDPEWVRQNHTTFDVFHLHFGFDAESTDSLDDLVRTLRAVHKPIVYTVHDLRNPHHPDPTAHDAHLDVLIPAADQLITLTPGAAGVIADRWGRTVHVLPHPHVVALEDLELPRRQRDEFVVGVHLKSVRSNMDCLPVVDVLSDVIAELPGAVLRVDVHTEVGDPESLHYRPELISWLDAARQRGVLRLNVHEFFSDEQLWTYLRDEVDLSVLPYRFGTHSGWLEACHDLGTLVAAPDCGFYAQQRPCFEYGHGDAGLDATSLATAVRRAYQQRPRWRATVEHRLAERRRVATAHYDLYSQVLRAASRSR